MKKQIPSITHRPNQQTNAVEKADDKTLVQMAIVYKIKPYAWWTFEKGKETDLTGRFLCKEEILNNENGS